MIIYFIRHGETEWNKKKITQGHKDSPLTLKGKKAAEKKGKILTNKDIEIIYSSDLGRCVQTAEIINKYLKIKLVKSTELRERDFGSLNGELDEKVRKELNLSDPKEVAPRGESFNQLKNRIIDFIRLLASKKAKKVLLVTHGGIVRAILSDYYKSSFTSKRCDSQNDLVYRIELINNKLKNFKIINN